MIEKTEIHQTESFKHFKLFSKSTLKSMSKDELIGYVYMLYYNWRTCDESYYNIISYAEKLNKALDASCKRLASICEEEGYCEELYCPYKKTDHSCMNMCNFSTIWREELMK